MTTNFIEIRVNGKEYRYESDDLEHFVKVASSHFMDVLMDAKEEPK